MSLRFPRSLRARSASLLLLVGAACGQYSSPDFCLELDGPCSGQSYGGPYTTRFYVLGFPSDWVDRSTVLPTGAYRGIVHVGDSFSLQLMMAVGDTTDGAGVTIQGAQWALPDSSAVHIESTTNGAGILTAVAPGQVTAVRINDQPYFAITSCDAQKQCVRISEIDILP